MFDMPVRVLSIFPDLLTYGILGIFLLRITLGIIILQFGYYKLFKYTKKGTDIYEHLFKGKGVPIFKTIAYIEFLAGISLIIGLFTQVWALVVALLMALAAFFKLKKPSFFHSEAQHYILLCITAIALMFLGAGAFAIDYPL